MRNSWRIRTFNLTKKLNRAGYRLDLRAWDDNENTDIDLINFEWGLYEEPEKDWRRYL